MSGSWKSKSGMHIYMTYDGTLSIRKLIPSTDRRYHKICEDVQTTGKLLWCLDEERRLRRYAYMLRSTLSPGRSNRFGELQLLATVIIPMSTRFYEVRHRIS